MPAWLLLFEKCMLSFLPKSNCWYKPENAGSQLSAESREWGDTGKRGRDASKRASEAWMEFALTWGMIWNATPLHTHTHTPKWELITRETYFKTAPVKQRIWALCCCGALLHEAMVAESSIASEGSAQGCFCSHSLTYTRVCVLELCNGACQHAYQLNLSCGFPTFPSGAVVVGFTISIWGASPLHLPHRKRSGQIKSETHMLLEERRIEGEEGYKRMTLHGMGGMWSLEKSGGIRMRMLEWLNNIAGVQHISKMFGSQRGE